MLKKIIYKSNILDVETFKKNLKIIEKPGMVSQIKLLKALKMKM